MRCVCPKQWRCVALCCDRDIATVEWQWREKRCVFVDDVRVVAYRLETYGYKEEGSCKRVMCCVLVLETGYFYHPTARVPCCLERLRPPEEQLATVRDGLVPKIIAVQRCDIFAGLLHLPGIDQPQVVTLRNSLL